MNQLLENILERSKWEQIGILAAIILLVSALYYSFVYSPRSDEVAKLADSVEIARNEKTVKTQKAANLTGLRRDLQQLDMQLKKAVAQLPNQKQVAALLTNISAKAQESGLQVLLFRPRAETFQDFYAEVPVDITVKGSFHNTVGFFDEVGRLNRLININNVGFKSTIAGDNVIMETTSVATAFRFLNDAERKKVAEDKAKAAKAAKK